jgi:hypothetical protein
MDVEKVKYNEVGQRITKRWARFSVDSETHHHHRFWRTKSGKWICSCGQTRRHQ